MNVCDAAGVASSYYKFNNMAWGFILKCRYAGIVLNMDLWSNYCMLGRNFLRCVNRVSEGHLKLSCTSKKNNIPIAYFSIKCINISCTIDCTATHFSSRRWLIVWTSMEGKLIFIVTIIWHEKCITCHWERMKVMFTIRNVLKLVKIHSSHWISYEKWWNFFLLRLPIASVTYIQEKRWSPIIRTFCTLSILLLFS